MPRRKNVAVPVQTDALDAVEMAGSSDVKGLLVTAVFDCGGDRERAFTYQFVERRKAHVWVQNIQTHGSTISDVDGVTTIYPAHRLLRVEIRDA